MFWEFNKQMTLTGLFIFLLAYQPIISLQDFFTEIMYFELIVN